MKRIILFTSLGLAAAAMLPAFQRADEFPSEIVKFKAYAGNPLFKGTSDPKTWDEKIRERGYILREGNQYYMWYTGYTKATGDSMKYLGLATSDDGLKWTRY